MILCMGKSAIEAWSKFENVKPSFKPFRDACQGSCSYKCTVSNFLWNLNAKD